MANQDGPDQATIKTGKRITAYSIYHSQKKEELKAAHAHYKKQADGHGFAAIADLWKQESASTKKHFANMAKQLMKQTDAEYFQMKIQNMMNQMAKKTQWKVAAVFVSPKGIATTVGGTSTLAHTIANSDLMASLEAMYHPHGQPSAAAASLTLLQMTRSKMNGIAINLDYFPYRDIEKKEGSQYQVLGVPSECLHGGTLRGLSYYRDPKLCLLLKADIRLVKKLGTSNCGQISQPSAPPTPHHYPDLSTSSPPQVALSTTQPPAAQVMTPSQTLTPPRAQHHPPTITIHSHALAASFWDQPTSSSSQHQPPPTTTSQNSGHQLLPEDDPYPVSNFGNDDVDYKELQPVSPSAAVVLMATVEDPAAAKQKTQRTWTKWSASDCDTIRKFFHDEIERNKPILGSKISHFISQHKMSRNAPAVTQKVKEMRKAHQQRK